MIAGYELMQKYLLKRNTIVCSLIVVTLAYAQGASGQGTTAKSVIDDGVAVGFTEEGHPYLGNADAPVTLEEWSDYLCPYCGRHFRQTMPTLLDRYVRTGKLRLVFRDLPLAGLHPTAAIGHIAANCVGEQGATAYWRMHDALFARQGEWNRLPDPSAFLAGVAEDLGVDMQDYSACITDGGQAATVAASVEEGLGLGYNGTPSFRFSSAATEQTYAVSGAQPLEIFSRYVDALVAGTAPPEEQRPEPPELPLWAKAEGLVPDPERPGFNLAGDAYKGNPEAKVVVIEFNDFECPACQKHVRETQPIIDQEFIDTGKILWVEKHFPLRVHRYAAIAAVAVECAGDQQRYWQMHGLLNADPERWANDHAEDELPALAKELELDLKDFRLCFDSRKGLERVLQDLYDAQGLITKAPTFVILSGDKGAALGPLPADQFIKLLNDRLEAAE